MENSRKLPAGIQDFEKLRIAGIQKVAVATLYVCALLFMASGCETKKTDTVEDDDELDVEFCSCLNTEDLSKTLPIVNEFLAGLANNLDDGQKLQTLAAWLKAQPCINDASVLCQSCNETDPPVSEILISFDEDGETKEFVLDVSMGKPLKAAGYRKDDRNCGEAWNYPMKPGMDEWKQLQSNESKVNACKIPDDILFCLSTEKLTDLCLQYPLFGDIFAFNFLDMGLNQLFINFNGIRELYKRKDVANYLIKRYMEKIQSLSLQENEKLSTQFWYSIWGLDALLSRVEQQENLKEILRNLVVGYEAISVLDNNSRFLQYNFFARAHVIIKICEQCLEEIPQGKNNAVFSPQGVSSETADIINQLSYQFIK